MRTPRLSARFWELMEAISEEALRNDRETFGPKSGTVGRPFHNGGPGRKRLEIDHGSPIREILS